jgi:hypothetical protein
MLQGCVLFVYGRYVGWTGFAKTWAPFMCVAALGSYFGRALFWYTWLAALPLALLIFWLGQQCRPRPRTASGPYSAPVGP